MTKELCHGLPPSRAKGGHAPGTSPGPVGKRLLLAPTTCATNITHRLVKVQRKHCDRSGTGTGNRVQPSDALPWTPGRDRSPRGSGWPPITGIARIRSRRRRAFPCLSGGRSGWRTCVQSKGKDDGSQDNRATGASDIQGSARPLGHDERAGDLGTYGGQHRAIRGGVRHSASVRTPQRICRDHASAACKLIWSQCPGFPEWVGARVGVALLHTRAERMPT